jgi:alkylation response protein AidB-like acyl-CoA dehydrogenase
MSTADEPRRDDERLRAQQARVHEGGERMVTTPASTPTATRTKPGSGPDGAWDTEDPERFRAEVVAWLDAHAPAKGSPEDFSATHLSAPTSAEDFLEHELTLFDRANRWQRELFDAGLASMSWPVEHGGHGLPAWCDAIVTEESTRYGVSTKVLAVGLNMMPPVLGSRGTPDQCVRYLPPVARGEEVWCQLFSEPDAGSDLPNIKATAARTDRGWVVNGQKVWNSGAVASDFGAAIVRTEPGSTSRRGLSLLVIDMHAPGVEVRPLRQMSGGYHFSEVFLTDVEVPDDALIGAPGEGWDLARTILGHERSAIGGGTSARSALQLTALAGAVDRRSDPVVRQALADAHIRERLLDLLMERLHAGATVPGGGSIVKLLYSEHARLSANAALTLLGPEGALRLGERDDGDLATPWIERFLFAPGLRIGGGTDEIQRNQIAEQGLGLPRDPRPPA